MFKHEQTAQEYHDQQRSMRASGLIQAIWESGLAPKMTEADTIEWVEKMFTKSVAIIEAYVRKEPFKSSLDSSPVSLGSPMGQSGFQSTGMPHLSDEKVAEGLHPPYDPHITPKEKQTPNGRRFAFASENQSKRAYAIWKGAGWEDYQVRTLAAKYGFQNTKKIPVDVYEQFCYDLSQGPTILESSSHLQ